MVASSRWRSADIGGGQGKHTTNASPAANPVSRYTTAFIMAKFWEKSSFSAWVLVALATPSSGAVRPQKARCSLSSIFSRASAALGVYASNSSS